MKTIIQKTKSLLLLLLFFISFSNSYGQSITTGTVSPYLVCLGNTIVVPFVATGNFNQNDFFRVQLSTTTGSFNSTPATIGSLQITIPISGTFTGSITATIPTTISASTQYRVRVVYVVSGATTPAVIGSRNTTSLILSKTKFNPTFTLPTSICSGTALTLPSTSNNNVTGTWSPTFNNTVTTNTTTNYTFTPTAGLCANVATRAITVNAKVTPTFNPISDVCSGSTMTALPTTSTNNIVGTWSPTLNNSETTTYTFTPNAGLCALTNTTTINVNPLITPLFSQIAPICSGDSFSLPTISENGISGSWSPELNFTETTTYTFTPSLGTCANIITMTVNVNPRIETNFDAFTAVCSGTIIDPLPSTSLNGIVGSWSPALNNENTTTYTFTPNPEVCATTINQSLVVNPSITKDTAITAYFTYTWSLTGQTYTTSGVYTHVANCLETVLNLTILENCIIETPAEITGTAIGLCLNGITNPTFSIEAVFGATNYEWTVPQGAEIVSGQGTTTITLNILSNFTEGNLSVRALNFCDTSEFKDKYIRSVFYTPLTPVGQTTGLCSQGLSLAVFDAAIVPGITNYIWTAPDGTSIISGQGSSTIQLSISETFSYGLLRLITENVCGSSAQRNVILRSVLATPGLITGTAVGLCQNGISTATYSIPAQAGAISYTWTAPLGTTIQSGQGTNSIELTVQEGFSSGNLSVVANTLCGSSIARTLAIRSSLAQPGVISGPSIGLCTQGISSATYTIAAVAGATSYSWTAPAGTSIVSGQGTNSIELSILDGFSIGNLSVVANNICGSSSPSTLSIRSTLSQLGSISGATIGLCSTQTPVSTYSVSEQTGASSYTWSIPTGTTIQSGQGTNSIVLSFQPNFTAGNISVTSNNQCGTSTVRVISIRSIPNTIGTITGQTNNLCTNAVNNPSYSISAVTGASSYTWTAPEGATINSGQGTTSITLNITSGFVSGNLSVIANNTCGSSAARTLALSSIPTAPGTITGTTNNLCTNGVNNPTYSIATVTGALSYTWTAPSGTTIVSGQGTNSITLNITSSFVSGNLSVVANNSCRSSTAKTLALSSIPITPGSITGTKNNLCPSGVSNPVFTIAAVAGASSYTWTVPTGTTIVSGQGTTSVTLEVSSSFSSGTLSVIANNACSSSVAKTLALSNTPLTPTSITGSITPCGTVTYTCATVAQAVSYTWTVPTGMEITAGQGTNAITVNVIASSVTGSITVKASNNCKTGNARSLAVNSCNISTRMSEASSVQVINENVVEVIVFPNPINDIISVQVSDEFEENVNIELINLIGQKVAKFEIQKGNTNTSATLDGMPSGIYILQASKSDGTLIYTTKILKQ
jgi:hypothetical protein